MCRSIPSGGRRCFDKTEYGRQVRNIQAKRQYHERSGNSVQAAAAEAELTAWREEHTYPHDTQHLSMNISPATTKMLNALTQAGLRPYIVGGSVRDALAGATPKDIDIEVYGADEGSLIAAARNVTTAVNSVGQQFGVVKATLDGEEFDLSLPRTENKTGNTHTDFEVTTSKDLTIEEAAQRRDFTVNALLYDPTTQKVIDPTGGLKDWEAGQLRHVGEKFKEDPLRVLRAVQMAARFNMTLHPDTVQMAATLKGEFPHIAKERVQIEFQKLFTKSSHPERGMQVLAETGWQDNFSGLAAVNTPALHERLSAAGEEADRSSLSNEHRAALFASMIAADMPERDRREFLSYITVGDKVKNDAYDLTVIQEPEHLTPASMRHWVRELPKSVSPKRWAQARALHAPDRANKLTEIMQAAEHAGVADSYEPDIVNGNMMMRAYGQTRGGRWMTPALDAARDAQYERKFTTVAEAEEWLAQMKDELAP